MRFFVQGKGIMKFSSKYLSHTNLLTILLTISLSFLAVSNLLKPGYFSMHDDIQIMRFFEINKCFQDGQIPCRWVPDMGGGYGHPLFNYHPVFPYYLGQVFSIFSFSFIDTTKILFLLSLVLSGIFMYLLAKEFFGKLAGLVAAIFFVYAPYHSVDIYVRGDLTESWGIAFFPLITLGLYKYLRERKPIWFVVSALSLAGLFLSHNIMTMLFVPVVLTLVLYWSIALRQIKKIYGIALIFLMATGLAAFFLLPSFFELPLINVRQIGGYYNFRDHFVTLNQLFINRNFGYGPSILGPNDTLSFQIGWPHWLILFIIPAVVIYFFRKKNYFFAGTVLLFLFFSITAIFMSHSKSVFIWEKISLLQFVQFPWRFLGIIIFTSSFLAASFVSVLKDYIKIVLAFVLIIAAIVLNYQYFRADKYYPNMTDQEMLSGENFLRQSMTTFLDYVPEKVKDLPQKEAADIPAASDKSVSFSKIIKGSNWWYFSGDNSGGKEAQIKIPIFYFPNWQVLANSKPAALTEDQSGLMEINVAPGKFIVQGKLTDTPLRKVANLISLLSIISLLGIFIFYDRRLIINLLSKGKHR
ncbi:MAG: YfhO family protein [Patescibacteria group bacterium]|nr:YfhO family protein [Patescibacteria group bacterium]